MSARNVIVSGALLTIVGSLVPFAHLPFVGTLTYVVGGKGDGMFAIGAAVIAALTSSEKEAATYRWSRRWLLSLRNEASA